MCEAANNDLSLLPLRPKPLLRVCCSLNGSSWRAGLRDTGLGAMARGEAGHGAIEAAHGGGPQVTEAAGQRIVCAAARRNNYCYLLHNGRLQFA